MSKEVLDDEEMVISADSPYGQSAPIIRVKQHIYFYAEVDTTITTALISTMHEAAMEMIDAAIENDFPIVPLHLHINSAGGSVSDALAIIQCIKDIQEGRIHKIGNIPIKIPVYTYIEGEVDSASSLIACVGTKRFCSKYALSLIHDVRQISYGQTQKVDDIQLEAANLQMFKDKFYDLYLSHSKLTKEQLMEICSKEDYSSPQQLVEYGFVDEIIE